MSRSRLCRTVFPENVLEKFRAEIAVFGYGGRKRWSRGRLPPQAASRRCS